MGIFSRSFCQHPAVVAQGHAIRCCKRREGRQLAQRHPNAYRAGAESLGEEVGAGGHNGLQLNFGGREGEGHHADVFKRSPLGRRLFCRRCAVDGSDDGNAAEVDGLTRGGSRQSKITD